MSLCRGDINKDRVKQENLAQAKVSKVCLHFEICSLDVVSPLGNVPLSFTRKINADE